MSVASKRTIWRRAKDILGTGNMTQRANGIAARVAARRNKPAGNPYPWMLQIEVTNRCNLNCSICSRSVTPLELGDLSPSLYPVVADISAHAQEVALFGYGEPLTSKAFYDLLPLLRSASIGFFTNGLLLDGDRFQRILDLAQRPLKYVVFSVDGATQEAYGAIRSGAPLKKVWANLENAIKMRESHGLKGPAFRIEFVAMADNIADLPELVRMADDAGVDVLKVSHLVVWAEAMRDQSLLYHPELARRWFRAAAEEAASRRVVLDLPRELRPEAKSAAYPDCRWPWHYAMINYQGHVRACCFSQEFDFGDLNQASFEDIWDGPEYRRLRSKVNTRQCPKPCLFCEERFRVATSPDDERTYIKLKPRAK